MILTRGFLRCGNVSTTPVQRLRRCTGVVATFEKPLARIGSHGGGKCINLVCFFSRITGLLITLPSYESTDSELKALSLPPPPHTRTYPYRKQLRWCIINGSIHAIIV